MATQCDALAKLSAALGGLGGLAGDSCDTLTRRGQAFGQQGRLVEAEAAFRKALRLDPGHAVAYRGLAGALIGQGRPQEAAYPLRQAVRLGLPTKESYNEVGEFLTRLGDFTGAVNAYRAALRLGPDPDTLIRLAQNLRWLGRDAEAQALSPDDLPTPPPGRQRFAVRPLGPVWDGSPLDGMTVLVRMTADINCGLGDAMMFVRFAPLLKAAGGRVVVHCPGRLVPLLSSCAGIDAFAAADGPLPPFDVEVLSDALPYFLKTTLATLPAAVPYLAAPAERVERWRPRVAALPGLRVGIVWKSAERSEGGARCAPLERFAPLAEIPGVTLVSLQHDTESTRLELAQAPFPVRDFSGRLDAEGGAFLDSAAVMQHLDLVISVDSSPAHLAGALGVPTWLILETPCDWRWLTRREDSLWYPTMRLFRQQTFGDWPGVFRDMAAALKLLAAAPPH